MNTNYKIGDLVILKSVDLKGSIIGIRNDNHYIFESKDGTMKLPVSIDMLQAIRLDMNKIFEDAPYLLIGQPKDYLKDTFSTIDFFFLNNSPHKINIDLQIDSNEINSVQKNMLIPSKSFNPLFNAPTSFLNSQKVIKINIQSEGIKESIDLKLKPQVFFNNLKNYLGFDKPIFAKALTPYKFETKRALKISKTEPKINLYKTGINLHEKMAFSNTIDLHIEALLPNTKVPQNEILSIQRQHFNRYLQKAINLNEEKIYIIHGIGKGTLKAMVHDILKETLKVKSYKNEYHSQYGFGATEVILS